MHPMALIRRTAIAVTTAMLLAGPAGEAGAAEYPLGHGKLLLKDGAPQKRRVTLRARFRVSGGPMVNPIFETATLRIYGNGPNDGDSTLLKLPPDKWFGLGKPAGRKGYRYTDETGSSGGIRSLVVKMGKKSGSLKLVGGGAKWPFVIRNAQSGLIVSLRIGDAQWCAELTGKALKRNAAGRVAGTFGSAPATCPCIRADGTFAAIQKAIFERHGCTNQACHGAARKEGGLDLSPDVAYANLVDVPSQANAAQKRVEPGDQARSMLWRKLAAATLSGYTVENSPMPVGQKPVSPEALEALRLWIRAGAPATGVVLGTETLLDACLPEANAPKIRRPDPPALGTGIQLYAPPWQIPKDGEDEVCYATWYDFTNDLVAVPAAVRTPCSDFWGGPSRECFYYDRTELTQDPNSHHSIIHIYKGEFDPATGPKHICRGGERGNRTCDPGDAATCPGGSCVPYDIRERVSGVGPFTCRGGAAHGTPCDPFNVGVPAPAGADCGPDSGCAGRVDSTIACIGYGPPDWGFDVTGSGTNSAPSIGGSQQPLAQQVYPPQVFNMLPIKAIQVWNSHAFNLTAEPTTNEQYLNVYFTTPDDAVYPVHGIFDSADIFVQDVPPFQTREYCRTHTLPQGARLFELSSHTHKFGKRFRVYGPGITQRCGSGRPIAPADCLPRPEDGAPIYESTEYNDPLVRRFDPPLAFDTPDENARTFKFCALYDNGATNPDEVKRQSTSPLPVFPVQIAGGPCTNATVACLAGPKKGQLCNGDHAFCGPAEQKLCDACPVRGGTTTGDEMFILIGSYYIAPGT